MITRRSFARTVWVAVLVIGLLALTGCADSSGETKTYTDDDYGYSFQYPENWKLMEGGSADVSAGGSASGQVAVYDPEGAKAGETFIDLVQLSIYQLSVTVDDTNMPDIKAEVENVLASLEGQAADLETVEPLAETSTAGMKGYAVTYKLAKNGAPITSTLYFLFSGDLEYQVTVQASDENWEKNQPAFEALLKSLETSPVD